MKLKTAKGNIQLLAEGDGVVLFQKQVSGKEWIQDIINDDVIGGLYYNSANATYMPDGLGTKSPFYYKIIKNTNGTFEGFEVIPYNHTFLYLNSGAGSFYKVGAKGLNKISLSKISEATSADKATSAEKLAYQITVDGKKALVDYSVGSNTQPVYFNSGVPVACDATVGSNTQPVYFNGGIPVACGTTVGAADRLIYMDSNGLQAGNIVKFARQRTLSQPGITWWTFGYAYENAFWNDKITKHDWQGSNICLYNAGGEIVYNDGIKVRVASQRIGSRVEANIEIIMNTATALDDYAIELTTYWFFDVVTSTELNKIKMVHCMAVPRKAGRDKGSPTLFTHVGDDSSRKKAWVVIDSSGNDNKFAGCYITLIGEVSA